MLSTNAVRSSRGNTATSTLISLFACMLVLTGPNGDSTAAPPAAIVYNDGNCDLGNPTEHQSSETAFEISTTNQLWEVTDCVSSSMPIHFKLVGDINVSSPSTAPTHSPIGYSKSGTVHSFSGVLNGQNYRISGIAMATTSYGVGLFAYLHNSTVSNLVISGTFSTSAIGVSADLSAGALAIRGSGGLDLSSISNRASVNGTVYVGGLVGYVSDTANVSFAGNYGDIYGSETVGGLIGYVGRTVNISSSYNSAPISANSEFAGGLVGYVEEQANIFFSHNSASVSAASNYAGGLAGAALTANISSSYNTGAVSISNEFAGGLVGRTFGDANIVSSHNQGAITAQNNCAGLVGFVQDFATITSSYNIGSVSGNSSVGGLVGRVHLQSASIRFSYNSGTVNGRDGVGGLLGSVASGSVVLVESFNTATVTGSWSDVAGLVGNVATDAHVDRSHNIGEVNAASNYVGGLLGYVGNNYYIQSSSNSGSITGFGSEVGGLVGRGYESVITSSSNTGAVTGEDQVGGLSGIVWFSQVTSSFNSGPVTGVGSSTAVGGLVGQVNNTLNVNFSHNSGAVLGVDHVGGIAGQAYKVNVLHSRNLGTVSGDYAVGGIVGIGDESATISSSLNSATVSGIADVGGLIGRVGQALIFTSYNSSPINGSWYSIGGLIGRSQNNSEVSRSYNLGSVSGYAWVAGLVGSIDEGRLTLVSSYNVGKVSGTEAEEVDSLVGGLGTVTLQITFTYTSIPSRHVQASAISEFRKAATFTGFDFSNVWGFGTCNQNSGLPILREFREVETYYAEACFSPAPPTQTPVRSYAGPLVDSKQSGLAGSQVTYTGTRLHLISSAFAGDTALRILSAGNEGLVLEVASSLSPGVYDLILFSSEGKLTFNRGLEVVSIREKTINPEPEGNVKLVTVGTFRGFIAIYTRGYQESKLSAKVAGKWLVVPKIEENWSGKDFSRTVRFAGPGQVVKVDIFISGRFISSQKVITK